MLVDEVDRAVAVRPHQAQASGARHGHQPGLLGAPGLGASLAEAAGEDRREGNALGDAVLDDAADALGRHDDADMVGRLGKVADRLEAGQAEDGLGARIDRIDALAPPEIEDVVEVAEPEAGPVLGGADDRHRARLEEAVQPVLGHLRGP
jgi:hypothetical protein